MLGRATLLVALAVGLAVQFVAAPAGAQNPVEIRTKAPAPEKPQQVHIVEPGPATREVTRPREADFYPGSDVRLRHEPAFIEPFAGETQGGTKYGLSGWTSPATPVGSYVAQESWARTGWPALGFSIVWNTAPLAPATRVSDPR